MKLLFCVKAGQKPNKESVMVLLLKILERSKIHLEYAMQSCILKENNNEKCKKGSRSVVHAFPQSLGSILH